MTVAELIEKLRLLPQDAAVIQEYDGRYTEDPELTLLGPGESYSGIAFDRTTLVL